MAETRYAFSDADIFFGIKPDHLDLIYTICRPLTVNSGQIIISEGTKGDELYIIAEGKVDIMINPGLVSEEPHLNHPPTKLTSLRRGQSFGEIALVDNGMRSATVIASQDNTQLIVIPRKDLLSLCEQYPDLGYRLMYNLAVDLAWKIRNTSLRIREQML